MRISYIFIQESVSEMSSAKWRPFCLGLNVLNLEGICIIFMMKVFICQHKLHRFLSLCPHCQERRGHIYAQWRPGCLDRDHISDLYVDGVIYANITNSSNTWHKRQPILHLHIYKYHIKCRGTENEIHVKWILTYFIFYNIKEVLNSKSHSIINWRPWPHLCNGETFKLNA